MKNLILVCALLLLISPAGAFELDWSADDEIRQNYEPSKLEQEVLPGLPGILKEDSAQTKVNAQTQKQTTVKKYSDTQTTQPPKTTIETDFSGSNKVARAKSLKNNNYTAVRIRKGTKFKVQSKTNVADWNTSGARMTFVSTAPVVQRYVSVPAGTTFKGVIQESHQPNSFGNGGLLKIKADSIILNGTSRPVDAKITKANDKRIFFNNIKGKRGYCKGVGKAVDKGQNFYNKSRKVSKSWSNNPIGSIVSPIPTIVGGAGYTLNFIISPVTALWSKGDHISIPAGSNYVIKLREHAYVN